MDQTQTVLSLADKQWLFASLVGRLLTHIAEQGYTCSLGEAWRTPEMAAIYVQQGKGIKNSLHILRLAIDLNLFKNGHLLENTEDHKPIGEWWKQQNEWCRWGGDFKDGNHYSMEHNGVK